MRRQDNTRFNFLLPAALAGLGLVGATLLAYATRVEPYWLSVSTHEPLVEGLPAAWDGLRITQLSDLHFGARGAPDSLLRRAVAETVRQRPDLIVLTGDYSDDGHSRSLRALALLARTAPTVAILGNHDYFADDGDAIAADLRALGITVLRNATLPFTYNGVTRTLVGFDDHLSGPGAAIAELASLTADDHPVLALIHAPDLIERFPPRWAGLTLAGHTHGAQVRLSPLRQIDWIRWSPKNNRSKYPRGWFVVHGNPLYVSRGLGVTGRPVRFAARPELAHFTLRAPSMRPESARSLALTSSLWAGPRTPATSATRKIQPEAVRR